VSVGSGSLGESGGRVGVGGLVSAGGGVGAGGLVGVGGFVGAGGKVGVFAGCWPPAGGFVATWIRAVAVITAGLKVGCVGGVPSGSG
jgi:hypothetical protein